MRRYIRMWTTMLTVVCGASLALGHCQIPCGIYGDSTRFTLMREHVTTIEKSMKEIQRLGKEKSPNHNQLTRWVINKDAHADELAEIVTYYFMAQRIKPSAEGSSEAVQRKYVDQISLLHRILVLSMKAKQTTDLQHCKQMRTLIDKFEKLYAGK